MGWISSRVVPGPPRKRNHLRNRKPPKPTGVPSTRAWRWWVFDQIGGVWGGAPDPANRSVRCQRDHLRTTNRNPAKPNRRTTTDPMRTSRNGAAAKAAAPQAR
ncbi:hypothetical protein GCM10022267_18410 [Lentzea roselyniae]|uniref:HNH endonuclease n=1 Tax=Lentzea roselyniae TaxID=531940 RepID=A0ABP7AGV6_9PSEU